MTDNGSGTTGEGQGEVVHNVPGSRPSPGYIEPQDDFSVPTGGQPEEPTPVRPITREMAARARELEQTGVPMWLDRTGIEATVKALSFADKTALGGIDPRYQAEITAGFNARGVTSSGKNVTFNDMLRGVGNEERLANAVACAGFIWPRLTLTKGEADLANDPDVWWVKDINILDRRKYCNYVLGMDEEEAKRIANFLNDRVASN